MAHRSRILFARKWVNKAFDIDKTLEKYKYYSARGLVSVTHREGAPWSQTQIGQVISDAAIKEYHYIE